MNLYYGINQTHRWPSTANKHIQVVLCCSASWPAWQQPRERVTQKKQNKKNPHTSTFVFLCETHVCVVAQQHLPSYKEAVWILPREVLRVFRTIFHVGWLYSCCIIKGKKFNESWIISLFVLIRLSPPFGSELHLFLPFHNFNFFFFFFRTVFNTSARPWQGRGAPLLKKKDDSLCSGPPEQSRLVCVCVCKHVLRMWAYVHVWWRSTARWQVWV